MSSETTWTELLKPGETIPFFNAVPLPSFRSRAEGYDSSNAWWLAELSRLIYRQDDEERGLTTKRLESSPASKSREEFLERVGLHERQFLSDVGIQCAVIESVDDCPYRFATVVFRGTSELADWMVNLQVIPVKWRGGGAVHSGFAAAFDRVWSQVEAVLESLDCPVFYTGHSLGAALATLAASVRPPAAAYTFGSPRVGNAEFASALAHHPLYRVVNRGDIVTSVPRSIGPLTFRHVGELHYLCRDGTSLVNPQKKDIKDDLTENGLPLPNPGDDRSWFRKSFRLLGRPPDPLADHAPINYVRHLQQLL